MRTELASIRHAKKLSQSLRDHLMSHAIEIGTRRSQEAVARMLGYADWHELEQVTAAASGSFRPYPVNHENNQTDRSLYRASKLAAFLGIHPAIAEKVVGALHLDGKLRDLPLALMRGGSFRANDGVVVDPTRLDRIDLEKLYRSMRSDFSYCFAAPMLDVPDERAEFHPGGIFRIVPAVGDSRNVGSWPSSLVAYGDGKITGALLRDVIRSAQEAGPREDAEQMDADHVANPDGTGKAAPGAPALDMFDGRAFQRGDRPDMPDPAAFAASVIAALKRLLTAPTESYQFGDRTLFVKTLTAAMLYDHLLDGDTSQSRVSLTLEYGHPTATEQVAKLVGDVHQDNRDNGVLMPGKYVKRVLMAFDPRGSFPAPGTAAGLVRARLFISTEIPTSAADMRPIMASWMQPLDSLPTETAMTEWLDLQFGLPPTHNNDRHGLGEVGQDRMKLKAYIKARNQAVAALRQRSFTGASNRAGASAMIF